MRAVSQKSIVPVFLYYGQNDHVLIPKENAERISPLIKTLVGVKMVPLADHWVFIDPCSPELAKDMKDICSDPPGVDRVKVHQQINCRCPGLLPQDA